MNKCPQCDKSSADGFDGEGAYTPGLPCSNCGYNATVPAVEPVEPAPAPESRPGALLRLVPPAASTAEQQRAACRRILLEALQRIESGEVDELVLLTVNSRQAPSPYTLRWQFADPIRMAGLLSYAAGYIGGPKFITLT